MSTPESSSAAAPEPVSPGPSGTGPSGPGLSDPEASGSESSAVAHAAAPGTVATKRKRRRRASAVVAVGGTLALAAAMANGGSDPKPVETTEDYAQVCRDETTQERLEDEECETAPRAGHSHVGWFFIPLSGGRTIPAVGQQASSGMTTRPGGTAVKVPKAGGEFAKSGTVSKGGFGSKGGGAGS